MNRLISNIIKQGLKRTKDLGDNSYIIAQNNLNKGAEFTKEQAKETLRNVNKNLNKTLDQGINFVQTQTRETLNQARQKIQIRKGLMSIGKSGFRWFRGTRFYTYGKWGLVAFGVGKISYIYGTQFKKEITISKSFHRYTRHGHNEYMLADQEHNLYRVTESLIFWQWFPTELWSSLKEGEKHEVIGYGIRIRKFGIYPNIVQVIK